MMILMIRTRIKGGFCLSHYRSKPKVFIVTEPNAISVVVIFGTSLIIYDGGVCDPFIFCPPTPSSQMEQLNPGGDGQHRGPDDVGGRDARVGDQRA